MMKVIRPAPAAITKANSSFRPEPCPRPPKSVIGSFPCSPALYASHKTTNSAITSPITIIHRVEFKRPFITFTPVAPLRIAAERSTNLLQSSNHRDGERLSQFLQIQCQRHAIFMPQHSATVRHLAGRFLHQ